MKFFALLPLVFVSSALIAAPITSHSNNSNWTQANDKERLKYASNIVKDLGGTYTATALVQCISKNYNDSKTQAFKVSKMAANCHTQLQ